MTDIVWTGSRDALAEKLKVLGQVLSGGKSHPLARDVATAIGFAALADISDDYVVKSRRGVGKIGGKWPELSPITIANRRIGPKDLQNPAIALRKKIVDKFTKFYYVKFLVSMDAATAKKKASRLANLMATKITGKSKVATLGDREVEILRDTGRGFNSLSPGMIAPAPSGWNYQKPSEEGGEDQIFEPGDGLIRIGTNVEYMEYHMTGTDRMPARPFLPGKDEPIPEEWRENWKDAAKNALIIGFEYYLKS